MKTILTAAVLALLALPAHADDAPRKEITATTPGAKAAPKPPPPRGCARTATGDLMPIPRSEGDDVDMAACKPAKKRKKLNIFQVNK